jgi:hypothetical protein
MIGYSLVDLPVAAGVNGVAIPLAKITVARKTPIANPFTIGCSCSKLKN